MTNDPPLDEMLNRMKKYKAFGGTQALPGESMEGESRFARLAAYQKLLPEPRNSTEAVAAALSLMRIAQIPFRDPEKDKESEPEALLGRVPDHLGQCCRPHTQGLLHQ